METPLHIHFRGMDTSPAVETSVRERLAKLERLGAHITRCDVTIEEPHRHQRKGRHFQVRIRLLVPSGEIAVDSHHGDDPGHEDLAVALRDAFAAAERQLESRSARL
jgi:ribosome-associated translation inhibitor RaiA